MKGKGMNQGTRMPMRSAGMPVMPTIPSGSKNGVTHSQFHPSVRSLAAPKAASTVKVGFPVKGY